MRDIPYDISGNGDAVVLIHGSMSTGAQWNPLVRLLSPCFKVITFDLSGYGKSPFPENISRYSLTYEGELLASVVERALEPGEPFHLVGHSYGGAVAFSYAWHRPEQVLSLTGIEPMAFHLFDSNSEIVELSSLMIREIQADIESGDALVGARKFMELWMTGDAFDRIPEREQEILARGVKKMVHDFWSAAGGPLKSADYAQLPMPVCLIAGRKSPSYSLEITQLLKQAIAHHHFEWVDGGHFSPVSHAKQVNGHIYDFLLKVSGGGDNAVRNAG